MLRLRSLLWRGCVAALLGGLFAGGVFAQGDLYSAAMVAIAEGRTADAEQALKALASSEPLHAGAVLDLALLYCAVGDAVAAERLFLDIAQRFAPPAPIMAVIARQRLAGCAVAPVQSNRFALQLARGTESNVNQGAHNPLFLVGSGSQQVVLELLPQYLPQGDQFTQVALDWQRDWGGGSGVLQWQARGYDRMSGFDTSALYAGLTFPYQMGSWRGHGSGGLGLTTLGGALYSIQQQVQLALLPPVGLPPSWQLALTGQWSRLRYPALIGFDGQTREARAVLRYQQGGVAAVVGLSAQQDLQQGERPGGNRSGRSLDLQWRMGLSPQWAATLGWQVQRWQGATAYLPGLIDVARQQQTQVLRTSAELQLSRAQSLVLAWQITQNDENVSVFAYRNRSLQLLWQWQPVR